MMETVGTSALAEYLGTSVTSIHNWRSAPDSDFPLPVTCVRGRRGKRPVYGWRESDLPAIRAWYAKRFRLDEEAASQRWKALDEEAGRGEGSGRTEESVPVHPGQLTLITSDAPESTAA